MADKFVRINNRSKYFYAMMGRFLSKREIVKELGFQVWDEDDKEWILCMGADDVVGFISHNRDTIKSFYVLPGNRGKGVGGALLAEAISDIKYNPIKTTATKMSRGVFSRNGFKEIREIGRYIKMIRNDKEN